jgi:hypothetical protein
VVITSGSSTSSSSSSTASNSTLLLLLWFHSSKITTLSHLFDNVNAANKLAFDVQLRICWPVTVLFQPLPHLLVLRVLYSIQYRIDMYSLHVGQDAVVACAGVST